MIALLTTLLEADISYYKYIESLLEDIPGMYV